MSTVADRVSAGIQLLDDNVEGWRGKVNIATLDLRNTRNCILGQVFKTDPDSWDTGYNVGRETLGLKGCKCCPEMGGEAPSNYGFDADLDGDYEYIDGEFEELQAEWERQLSLVSA